MEKQQSLRYSRSSKESILRHAQTLVGQTLHDLYADGCAAKLEGGKGKIGDLVEQLHFGLARNNESRPDFPEAELELKTTAVVQRKNEKVAAKERLSLSMIDYQGIISETFYTSAFLFKNAYLLILVYMYEKNQTPCRNKFLHSFIYTIPNEDKSQIMQDWLFIQDKVRRGDAHRLSESDTLYLAAATKGSSSTDVTAQPCGETAAKRRAFCLKRSYLDHVIKSHLGLSQKKTVSLGSIANPVGDETSLEDMVIERCSRYIGMNDVTLFHTFGVKASKSKNWASMLVKRMLGFSAKDEVTEFLKAGVNVKSVTTTDARKLKESMSFAQIDYEAVLNEDWETSYWNSIVTNKFLIMVFDNNTANSDSTFRGAFFWSLPSDAQEEAVNFWSDVKMNIENEDYSSLYTLRSASYYHVRPKAKNAADVRLLNGVRVKKMAYWINRDVVYNELKARGYILS